MQGYPLVLQKRMTRLHGNIFLAPTRLYFVCEKQGGALAAAIGQQFGLLGAAVNALMQPKPGQPPPIVDEQMLQHACSQAPGSMIIEPSHIKKIRFTMWQRGIWLPEGTFAFPNGLNKDLSRELGLWATANAVDSKGLK